MNTFNSFDDDNLFSVSPQQENPFKTSGIMKTSKKIFKETKTESDISSESSPSSPNRQKKHKARSSWKASEDAKLLSLIQEHGQRWSLIGDLIGSKSCKQFRDRYLNFLRPDINRSPFTTEEDNLLISLYKKFGKKFKMISDHMPNRSEIQVKNRYHRHLSKRALDESKKIVVENKEEIKSEDSLEDIFYQLNLEKKYSDPMVSLD